MKYAVTIWEIMEFRSKPIRNFGLKFLLCVLCALCGKSYCCNGWSKATAWSRDLFLARAGFFEFSMEGGVADSQDFRRGGQVMAGEL